jgi:hypothetical protein
VSDETEPAQGEAPQAPSRKERTTQPGLSKYVAPLSVGGVAQLFVAVGLVLAAVKILAVSHLAVPMAVAILQGSGFVPPIVGTALWLLPALLLFLLAHLILYRGRCIILGNRVAAVWAATGAGWVFILLISMAPWPIVVLATVSGGLLLIQNRHMRRAVQGGGGVYWTYQTILVSGLTAIVGLTLVTVAADSMWLPKSRVTMAQEDVYGYVLNESEPWVVLLRDEPRELLYLDPSAIEQRSMCRIEADRRTIFEFLSRAERPDVGVECS